MKAIFSIFLMVALSGLALSGQAPEKRFVGNCSFSGFALLSDSTYRGDIVNFTDRFGDGYNLNQLAVGYEILDGRGLVFEVDTIHSATNFTADVSVTAKVDRGFAPFGSGQAYSPTENGLIPPSSQEQAGLSPTQKARVDRHNVVVMQSLIGGRDSVYSIASVPDTSGLSPVLGDAFVNATADTLGLYDGAGWVLFFGGSQSADGFTILGDGTGGDPFRVNTDSLHTKMLSMDGPLIHYLNPCEANIDLSLSGTLFYDSIRIGDNLSGLITEDDEVPFVVVGITEWPGYATFTLFASNVVPGVYFPGIYYAGELLWSDQVTVVAGSTDTVTVFDPPGQDSILVTRVCGAEVSRDTIASGVGSGTVTSVGLSLPSQFAVTGSPVTSSGTLAGAWQNQAANTVLAGPTTGASAAPTFRSLVAADITAGGGVTGSGTANYVPKFSSSTALNNSMIYQRDTFSVGINTSNPLPILEVRQRDVVNRGNNMPGGISSNSIALALYNNPAIVQNQPGVVQYFTYGSTVSSAFPIQLVFMGTSTSNVKQVATIGAYAQSSASSTPFYVYIDSRNNGAYNNATLKIDNNNRIGVAIPSTTRPSYTLDVSGTDGARIPLGTTAQRPTGGDGVIRFNTTLASYEGYGSAAWNSILTTQAAAGKLADGSVAFGGPTGISEDNSNLFWNDTDNLLGIATNTPTARVHLPGGTATAGTSSLKIIEGVNTTTPEDGAINHVADRLNFTSGSTVNVLAHLSDITDSYAAFFEEGVRQYALFPTADTITIDTFDFAQRHDAAIDIMVDSIGLSTGGIIVNQKSEAAYWKVDYGFFVDSDQNQIYTFWDVTTDGSEDPESLDGSASRSEISAVAGINHAGRSFIVRVPSGEGIRLCAYGNPGVTASMDISFLSITVTQVTAP